MTREQLPWVLSVLIALGTFAYVAIRINSTPTVQQNLPAIDYAKEEVLRKEIVEFERQKAQEKAELSELDRETEQDKKEMYEAAKKDREQLKKKRDLRYAARKIMATMIQNDLRSLGNEVTTEGLLAEDLVVTGNLCSKDYVYRGAAAIRKNNQEAQFQKLRCRFGTMGLEKWIDSDEEPRRIGY